MDMLVSSTHSWESKDDLIFMGVCRDLKGIPPERVHLDHIVRGGGVRLGLLSSMQRPSVSSRIVGWTSGFTQLLMWNDERSRRAGSLTHDLFKHVELYCVYVTIVDQVALYNKVRLIDHSLT